MLCKHLLLPLTGHESPAANVHIAQQDQFWQLLKESLVSTSKQAGPTSCRRVVQASNLLLDDVAHQHMDLHLTGCICSFIHTAWKGVVKSMIALSPRAHLLSDFQLLTR